MAHQRVSQLGRATSFSKFYPCLAHKRVSQVEMATSFSKFYSKFYPRVAHQRVSQVEMATSFSKLYPPDPCMAHKRVSQVEMATSFSKFYPRVAHQRVSQLRRPSHDVSARATTSIPSFYATQCNIGQKKSGAKRLLELPDDYIHETAPLLPASQEFQAKQHRTARTGCESFVNRARLPRG